MGLLSQKFIEEKMKTKTTFTIIFSVFCFNVSVLFGQMMITKPPFEIIGTPALEGHVEGSSYLVDDKLPLKTYAPWGACDANWKTAWAVHTPDSGKGEWIKIEFSRWALTEKYEHTHVKLARIMIVNGVAANKTLYYANNRVKKMEIEFDGGEKEIIEMKDGIPKYQTIVLKTPVWCKWIKMTILEIYKGSKYNDTCIGEMVFLDERKETDIMKGKR
jgi:hypothetical protein